MLVTGELENVPLLDVLQVIAHAKQSGILSVEGKVIHGSVLFEGGAIVCTESTSLDRPDPTALVVAESTEKERERSQARFSPTLIPAAIEEGTAKLAGHLTNVSEGGAFFHGMELPRRGAICRVRFSLPGAYGLVEGAIRVVWVRADGATARRGAGLAFAEMSDDDRGRLLAYRSHYQRLADEYRTGVGASSPAATPENLRR
jgi:PilZ domain/Domain of unknown function (DUF4388)